MTKMPRSSTKRRFFAEHLSRRLVLLLASVVIVLSSPISASSTQRLYVFINADMRAHALETELERYLSGVDVTVFGRIRGLEAALIENPDGVLACSPVLEAIGLRSELQGYEGSRSTEAYVLLSVDRAVSPGELDGKMLGAVNILGRDNMESFVRNLVGGATPKLKYVTHERDLLALLQFGAVTAVVTSQKWAERLQERSEMNLKVTLLGTQVGLPAVSFPSSASRSSLEGKVRSAGGAFNGILGVTQWK